MTDGDHWPSTGAPRPGRRAVLFDVDGTLLDTLPGLRRVWEAWADRHGLDRGAVWRCATSTRPQETFARVAPERDPERCLSVLHELEDADARGGAYTAFEGAAELLAELPENDWALVTSNYDHRVRIRFERCGLPVPALIVDAAGVHHGKPHPEAYLVAARKLGRHPADCLVIEDSLAGAQAGRRAGMTVWAVNGDLPEEAADRRYSRLVDAAPAVSAWLAGDG